MISVKFIITLDNIELDLIILIIYPKLDLHTNQTALIFQHIEYTLSYTWYNTSSI